MLLKVRRSRTLFLGIMTLVVIPLSFPSVIVAQGSGETGDSAESADAAGTGTGDGSDRITPSASELDLSELERFFAEHPRSDAYSGIRDELESLLRGAESVGVPSAPLMAVLQEAAAKRVPAERVIAALEREADRLTIAATILDQAELVPEAGDRRGNTLRRMSVYLQGALTIDGMRGIAVSAENLQSALEAMEAVSSVTVTAGLSSDQQQSLGNALLESELDPSGYGAIRSAYVKGRLSGLSPKTITEIVVRILEAGGGIIQIDRELTARGRR